MMSHGRSFKPDFQRHVGHVWMITQMKACVVQMGIPFRCPAWAAGLMKGSFYSSLLGQAREQSAFLSRYGSYESLVFLNVRMVLEMNSSVPRCIPPH